MLSLQHPREPHSTSPESTDGFQQSDNLHLTWSRPQALLAFQLSQLVEKNTSPSQASPTLLCLCWEAWWADSPPRCKASHHLYPSKASTNCYCSTFSPDLHLLCKYRQKGISPKKYTSSWVPHIWHSFFFFFWSGGKKSSQSRTCRSTIGFYELKCVNHIAWGGTGTSSF